MKILTEDVLKKCVTLFTENKGKAKFESFWNLKDFNLQNSNLCAFVQKTTVSRERPKDGYRAGKKVWFKYLIKFSIKTELVCKKYFYTSLPRPA